jgi:four helix bundle protein
MDSFRELRVCRAAFDAVMLIFQVSKDFPLEERFSLTDQIRRFSRSVCQQIAEVWRQRPYPKAFSSKLTGAAGEADETRVGLTLSHSLPITLASEPILCYQLAVHPPVP